MEGERMTKAQQILDYMDENPAAPQADIADALGFSRQIVSFTLKQKGLAAAESPVIIGPPCMYCRKEVTSRKWRNGRTNGSPYHRTCKKEANVYHGVCPVCEKEFSRPNSKINRQSNNGVPSSGVVTCSNDCRMEALHRGLFRQQI